MIGLGNSYEMVTFESLSENATELLIKLGEVEIVSTETNLVLYTLSIEQSRKPAAQTTLTYFMGTSLRSYFLTNISDAKSAIKDGALGDGGRYIYLLPSTSGGAFLYEVTLEGGECVETLIKEYISFASLNYENLTSVIEEVKVYIDFDPYVDGEPQRMNLILSGHGTGWVPYATTLSVATADGGVVESWGGSAMWEPENPAIITRYMGASSDGFMEISELEMALEYSNTKFGYIIFDACYMSSIELLYRLRNCSDYIVASPCEIMGSGFPSKTALPTLFTNNGSDFDLQGLCEAYNYYYTYEATYKYGCIAMCVTSELEALAESMSRVSRDADRGVVQSYDGYTYHVYYDLGDYINQAGAEDTADLGLFNTQFDKAFPPACRLHTDKFYSGVGYSGAYNITNYYGVTTSEISTQHTTSWSAEEWAQDSAYQ